MVCMVIELKELENFNPEQTNNCWGGGHLLYQQPTIKWSWYLLVAPYKGQCA